MDIWIALYTICYDTVHICIVPRSVYATSEHAAQLQPPGMKCRKEVHCLVEVDGPVIMCVNQSQGGEALFPHAGVHGRGKRPEGTGRSLALTRGDGQRTGTFLKAWVRWGKRTASQFLMAVAQVAGISSALWCFFAPHELPAFYLLVDQLRPAHWSQNTVTTKMPNWE